MGLRPFQACWHPHSGHSGRCRPLRQGSQPLPQPKPSPSHRASSPQFWPGMEASTCGTNPRRETPITTQPRRTSSRHLGTETRRGPGDKRAPLLAGCVGHHSAPSPRSARVTPDHCHMPTPVKSKQTETICAASKADGYSNKGENRKIPRYSPPDI
jgi:hypothetical protein